MLSVCVFFPFSAIKFISSFIWFSVDTNNLLQVAHNDNQDKSEFENCSWLLIPDLDVIRVLLIFIALSCIYLFGSDVTFYSYYEARCPSFYNSSSRTTDPGIFALKFSF